MKDLLAIYRIVCMYTGEWLDSPDLASYSMLVEVVVRSRPCSEMFVFGHSGSPLSSLINSNSEAKEITNVKEIWQCELNFDKM